MGNDAQPNAHMRALQFLQSRESKRANSLEIGLECGIRNVPHAILNLRKKGYQIDSVVLPEVTFRGNIYHRVAEYFLVGFKTGYVYKSRGWGIDRRKGTVEPRGPKRKATPSLGKNVGKLDLTKKGFLV